MQAGHVLLALAYALVAVPAYALLRGLAVPRWPAAGLAVASILGPWMVFGTTMLNVTLAAPLTVLFVWAAWRAVVAPTFGAELLAIAVAGLMTTARASHAVFFAGAVLAAVLAAWWTRPSGTSLRDLPRLVLRRNPLIVGIAVLAALVVAIIGPSTLAGQAYDAAARIKFPLDQIWDSLGWNTAVLAIATGFVAVPVGGAWALRQAVRPTDVRAGAFAVIALSVFLLYTWVAGASGAEEQERYPAFLAAFPLIALGAALYRRGEAWVLGTVVVALLCARAIATRAFEEVAEPLSYFFAPAQLFFSKVVVGRLTTALPGDEHMVTVATLLAAALAVAVAASLAPHREGAWHRNPKVPGTVVVAVLACGAISGVYTLRKYEPATAPGSLEAVAWLDRAGGGDDAVFWNYQWSVNAADRDVMTRQTLYHNGSACCGEWRPDPELFVRDREGRLDRDPVPRVVAGFDSFRPVVFAATQIARPTAYGHPMRVERFVGDEPRAAALVVGAGEDGAVEDEPAEIVAFPALAGHEPRRGAGADPLRDRRRARAAASRRGALRPGRGPRLGRRARG
jgi:hypothetical protein